MKRISMIALMALTVTAFASCDIFMGDSGDAPGHEDTTKTGQEMLDPNAGLDSLITEEVEAETGE